MATINDYAPGFAEDSQRRQLSMALAEGVEAFQEDGKQGGNQRWLWPSLYDLEFVTKGTGTETRWERKLRSLRLRNVWMDSLRSAASLPFDKTATLSDDWPRTIVDFSTRVDDLGNSFTLHWSHAFLMKLVGGVHFLLIDMPQDVGGDPYWTSVVADQVLGVVTSLVGSRHRAEEVRISLPSGGAVKPGEKPDDWPLPESPSSAASARVRIYRTATMRAMSERGVLQGSPVTFRHSVIDPKTGKWVWQDDWQELEAKTGVFEEIPLIPTYGNRVAPFRGRPRFHDTAREQAALIRALMAYDERENRDAKNMVVFSGVTPDKVHELANGAIALASKDADGRLLETTGAALKALRDGHEDRMDYIRTGNLRPMLTKPQPMTATEIRVHELGASSELEQSILSDIAAYEMAFEWTSQLGGTPGAGTISMPHDFSLDPQAVKELWQAWKEGAPIPARLVFGTIKTAGWIPESENVDELAKESEGIRNAGI